MKNYIERSKMSWKRIFIFFFIATAISNIFRFDIFELRYELQQLPTWIFILTTLFLEGSGVIIGALTAIAFLQKTRKTEITFFGTSKRKSLVMAVIPVIIFTIIGVKNRSEMDSHLYGFIAITGTLLYCLMEEYGWRGYLQEELKLLRPWKKYLIIGLLWYVWHLAFLTKATVGDNLFFLIMLIFGSWGIGQIAELTRSILASACFHLIIQVMMFNALIKNGISAPEKLIISGVTVVLWILIIKKWKKENTIAKTA